MSWLWGQGPTWAWVASPISIKAGAVVVALLLVVGATIYLISTNEGRGTEGGGDGQEEETFTPIMLPNSQTTNVPQANNEPSIAGKDAAFCTHCHELGSAKDGHTCRLG